MTDLSRYHRQMLLPGIGEAGQAALGAAHCMVIGCGALGCAAADLLARAGVGRLTLIDRDVVELTNLQRQTLFTEADAAAGRPKAEAAAERIRQVNSTIAVTPLVEHFAADSAEAIVLPQPRPTVLLDCTDNFQTRYLINDVAVKHGIALAYGGAVATTAMNVLILPGKTPCLRCLFPEPPAPGSAPTCDTAGVLASATAMVGALQAADAIRAIVGIELPCTLRFANLFTGEQRTLNVAEARFKHCECCGLREFEYLAAKTSRTTVLCGRNSVQVEPPSGSNGVLDLPEMARRLSAHGKFAVKRGGSCIDGALTLKTQNGETMSLTLFADGRAIVTGTTDETMAQSVYDRFVGG